MGEEWTFEYSEALTRKLRKLQKRNPKQFAIILKKREEIKRIIPQNPDHYKFLSENLKGLKRVHIDTHFVLTFNVDKERKLCKFMDFDQHDNIY